MNRPNTLTVSPQDNLQQYLREVRTFPMLEADKEYDLAKRWRDHGDIEAAHRLVESYLRLAVKVAMGYRGYGLPLGEIIAEGNVGLIQAVQRFDPDRGFRLSTYAGWWIRAAIQEYVLHNWSLVKMGTTAAQKKLFFSLRRLKNRLNVYEDGDLSDETVRTIARELEVSEDEVVEMNRRLGGDRSLNQTLRVDSESEWQDFLTEEREDQESVLIASDELRRRRQLLERGLERLDDRERHIFTERRLKDSPKTLEDLSREYGVSRERIRQIEVRAFEKVQKAVRRQALAA